MHRQSSSKRCAGGGIDNGCIWIINIDILCTHYQYQHCWYMGKFQRNQKISKIIRYSSRMRGYPVYLGKI